MRTLRGLAGLAFVTAFAAACSAGGGAATSTAASAAPTAAPSVEAPSAASVAPSPSADACAPETLALKTAGKLTIGADNPAYPPYFEPSDTNPDPWELGDPTNGKGFESAVGFAIADEMGFAKDAVTWVYTGFNNAIQPGPKDFDLYLSQVSYSPERAQAVDISDGYYDLSQSLVVPAKSKFAKAATIADLKAMQLGAQVGTTSLKTITDVVAPSSEPKVYDSNDAAVAALQNGQIDGLVVDLPTASYVSGVQLGDGIIVGQFADSAAGEHFGAALDKDSPLTACVNAAIGRLNAAGTLDALATQWLPDLVNVPVFQP
jgi:polar amino acid transport system substrate-binding protein